MSSFGSINEQVLNASGVGTWVWMLGGGGASPYDLPERVALDARASLARRVGASAVRVPYHDSHTVNRCGAACAHHDS